MEFRCEEERQDRFPEQRGGIGDGGYYCTVLELACSLTRVWYYYR